MCTNGVGMWYTNKNLAMTMNFTIVDKTKLGFCLLAGVEMLLI